MTYSKDCDVELRELEEQATDMDESDTETLQDNGSQQNLNTTQTTTDPSVHPDLHDDSESLDLPVYEYNPPKGWLSGTDNPNFGSECCAAFIFVFVTVMLVLLIVLPGRKTHEGKGDGDNTASATESNSTSG